MNPATRIPDEYRERLTAIVQKTYDEHGVRGRAWGIAEDGRCAYSEGCAIGISMEPEVAAAGDARTFSAIDMILNGDMSHDPDYFARELLGIDQKPPQSVISVLGALQDVHDQNAKKAGTEDDAKLRELYRGEIEELAHSSGLHLTL